MENTAKSLSGLKKEDFQKVIQGKQTDLYFLRNSSGMEVAVTNYGGSLVAIMVPDRNGNYANVIQGHDNIDDCISSPEPFLSTLVGRYGNRIAMVNSHSMVRNIALLSTMVLTTCTVALPVSTPAYGTQSESTTTPSCYATCQHTTKKASQVNCL